ncbi:Hpt domain-containing protein [Photobacterium aphoticum]|uniref:HPt domain-containing protein n=1 Tax=Photobacterium aphoticum TaxID=754436 RepID=A0A0J1JH23_9GAMM|nr:Hpt domain-containing protein [Photobacterium aphoticum]KLV01157.1 hypothetical protein ABT58_08415 [Photobacterium aphoticum]PSU54832.1 Hpt domain-containing protein [Photobacterium aphoticum]GHA49292.1 hypothetical protein GCM10007086_23810 [Photobacterium aphoticum]
MINYAALCDAMDGDEDVISMLIELYMAEHGDDIALMKQHYRNNAMDELFITVHSLKGVLLTLCEEHATVQLEPVETLCKRGDKPAPAVMEAIYTEVQNINQQIATLPLAL